MKKSKNTIVETQKSMKESKINSENYKYELPSIFITHDMFFRFLFLQFPFAKAFLQKMLPEKFINKLDFTKLVIEPPEFLDSKFRKHCADAIYQIPYKTSTRKNTKERMARIYIILEHKSYEDPLTIFQLARYIVNLMERSLKI